MKRTFMTLLYNTYIHTYIYIYIYIYIYTHTHQGLPWWFNDKESACNVGDTGSILGLERSPGEGNGNPFQYSCLENPMDRGPWWATVHGVIKE